MWQDIQARLAQVVMPQGWYKTVAAKSIAFHYRDAPYRHINITVGVGLRVVIDRQCGAWEWKSEQYRFDSTEAVINLLGAVFNQHQSFLDLRG